METNPCYEERFPSLLLSFHSGTLEKQVSRRTRRVKETHTEKEGMIFYAQRWGKPYQQLPWGVHRNCASQCSVTKLSAMPAPSAQRTPKRFSSSQYCTSEGSIRNQSPAAETKHSRGHCKASWGTVRQTSNTSTTFRLWPDQRLAKTNALTLHVLL